MNLKENSEEKILLANMLVVSFYQSKLALWNDHLSNASGGECQLGNGSLRECASA